MPRTIVERRSKAWLALADAEHCRLLCCRLTRQGRQHVDEYAGAIKSDELLLLVHGAPDEVNKAKHIIERTPTVEVDLHLMESVTSNARGHPCHADARPPRVAPLRRGLAASGVEDSRPLGR
jgi:hypothetical protein